MRFRGIDVADAVVEAMARIRDELEAEVAALRQQAADRERQLTAFAEVVDALTVTAKGDAISLTPSVEQGDEPDLGQAILAALSGSNDGLKVAEIAQIVYADLGYNLNELRSRRYLQKVSSKASAMCAHGQLVNLQGSPAIYVLADNPLAQTLAKGKRGGGRSGRPQGR